MQFKCVSRWFFNVYPVIMAKSDAQLGPAVLSCIYTYIVNGLFAQGSWRWCVHGPLSTPGVAAAWAVRSLLWRPPLSSWAALQLRPGAGSQHEPHCSRVCAAHHPSWSHPSHSWPCNHPIPLGMPGSTRAAAGPGRFSSPSFSCHLWLWRDGAVGGAPWPVLPHCPNAPCLHPTSCSCYHPTDMSGAASVYYWHGDSLPIVPR